MEPYGIHVLNPKVACELNSKLKVLKKRGFVLHTNQTTLSMHTQSLPEEILNNTGGCSEICPQNVLQALGPGLIPATLAIQDSFSTLASAGIDQQTSYSQSFLKNFRFNSKVLLLRQTKA